MKNILSILKILNPCSWKITIGNSSVLKYTEYKKKQALWLQVEDKKRKNKGTNSEQFYIQCYLEYLNIIRWHNDETIIKIGTYFRQIGTYHIETGIESWNRGYDEKVANNIDELMDSVLK